MKQTLLQFYSTAFTGSISPLQYTLLTGNIPGKLDLKIMHCCGALFWKIPFGFAVSKLKQIS